MNVHLVAGIALAIGCSPGDPSGSTPFTPGDVEMLEVVVPVDHGDPDGPTTTLQAGWLGATGDRIGPLTMNYGGPGAPAVGRLAAFANAFPELSERFDLVALDPRLTGARSPFPSDCMPLFDQLMQTEFDALEGPAYDAQRAARAAWLSACATAGGPVADHTGALDTARDLEILREQLGGEPLTYVGFSWGTALGQVFAEHFPDGLRAAYLDGVAYPGGAYADFVGSQARGFQASFEDWARWCEAAPAADCPLDDPAIDVADLLDELRVAPIPSSAGRDLTYARAWNGVTGSLYGPETWSGLAQDVASARDGDVDPLLARSDSAVGTDGDGHWSALFASYYLTECHDLSWPESDDALAASVLAAEADSPRFGAGLAMEVLTCMAAEVANDPLPAVVTAPDAPTMLLVAGEHDPATPYEVGVEVAGQLHDAVLLTWTGEGHVAFGDSACVTQAAFDYLIDLVLPADVVCD